MAYESHYSPHGAILNTIPRSARKVVFPLAFEAVLSKHDANVAMRSTVTWPVGSKVRQAIYSRDNGRCYYCGCRQGLTIDHKVPRSGGGSNHSENLVAACKSCNSAKGTKQIDGFIRHRFDGGAA